MGLVDQLFSRPAHVWAYLGLLLLVAIPVHEFAHAIVARWSGDPTPDRQGRVTIDPLKHLDPLGTLLIILGVFGWGRPVPVNPANFRSPRWGLVLVSAAGPAANILLAALVGIVGFRLGLLDGVGMGYRAMAQGFIWMNLGLAFFNLIPVPPLDGSKVLLGLLPAGSALRLARYYDRFGLLLLLLLLITGSVGRLVIPPVEAAMRVLVGW
ncbi:MAG: site-2 protease family protein [Armatimonadota bacterium]|nr:site-2 protease family protein [Armatimonadota bacterium]